jgi:ADP-dependent NAD(P)H-hydrate dehydratase
VSAPIAIDEALLRAWPLPMPTGDGDKEERGRILLIGGSPQMPGAVMLAAKAAMRAGAGKLTVATSHTVARLVATRIPEAKVVSLDEDGNGDLLPGALQRGAEKIGAAFDGVVIGPGMEGGDGLLDDCAALLALFPDARIVLDAFAMACLPRFCARAALPAILLTPHAGEMAALTGRPKDEIAASPDAAAIDLARRWRVTVMLKGARTVLAHADGRLWEHCRDNVGLAVSGSGDTLAGIVGGLAARGAPLEQAAAWGAALHARAGEALAARMGPLGYLPRELADEVPRLMHTLAGGTLAAGAGKDEKKPAGLAAGGFPGKTV